MADDVNTLSVAAVLQYFAILVACQMLLITRKNRVDNGTSTSSKVVDFGTKRKRVCDFLLVMKSNLCPILPQFRGIAGFLLITASHPISPEFWGVPLGLPLADLGSPRSEDPKLIIRVIAFEQTQYIRPRYHNVTDG